jgi:hypothetical protein
VVVPLVVAPVLASSLVAPRTRVVARVPSGLDAPEGWVDAVMARLEAADVQAERVASDARTLTVEVDPDDVANVERNLEANGELTLYAACAAPPPIEPRDDVASEMLHRVDGTDEPVLVGPGDRVRAFVDDPSEAQGATRSMYEAVSAAVARTRCVETQPLAELQVRTAEASIEPPPALVLSFEPETTAAIDEVAAGRAGHEVLIVARHTVLGDATLPFDTRAAYRMPLVGGELASPYARFFARTLSVPPAPGLEIVRAEPRSVYDDPAARGVGIGAVVLALLLGARAWWGRTG